MDLLKVDDTSALKKMPEEMLRAGLMQALIELEDHRLENHITKNKNYQVVNTYLKSAVKYDKALVNRILTVCVHDMKEDLVHAANVVTIISLVLNKIKSEEYIELPDLIPSALGIINMINTTGLFTNIKMEALRTLVLETLLSFPDEVLVTVAVDHFDELIELFNRSGNAQEELQFQAMSYEIIHKLLIILPPERKREFVKAATSVCLGQIIPTVLTLSTCSPLEATKALDVLEALTEQLLTTNYMDNNQWPSIMQCICSPNGYPKIIKNLLEKKSPVWHRLWIVFIRLLNNQITKNTNNIGTPINSMLPVVETAFKMDALNRCKAFQCWSVLIDIFSKETNEHCIMKRLKLLVIPMRLNNAKVDETAMAKFEAWWYLITKFQTKLDKYIATVLIDFLHFCFGKPSSSGKNPFIPGQLSEELKKRGVEAFVEILGHVECEGCTDLPRLKNKLINTKHLVDYFVDWAHSLKKATKFCMEMNNKQHLLCLWKSFFYTIAHLPDSNVKKGVFVELLTILDSSLQDCKYENISRDIIFEVLISSLFEEDLKLTNLLKPNEFQVKGVLNTVILIILNPSLKSLYQSLTMQDFFLKIKPLTNFIVNEATKCSSKITMEQILSDLPSNDATLMLWSAIAEIVYSSEYEMCAKEICYILLWPLKSSNMFTDVHYAAKTWTKLYDVNFLNLNKTGSDKHISQLLLSCNIVMHSSIYFALCATAAVLKNGLSSSNSTIYDKEAGLLKTLLNRIDDYENIQEISPMLVDTLVVMINNATNTINVMFAEVTLMAVKFLLKLIHPVIKQQSDISKTVTLLKLLFKALESFFEVESYFKLHFIILDNVQLDFVHFKEQEELKDFVQFLLKKIVISDGASNNKPCDSIDLTTDDPVVNDPDTKFTTPNIDVPKKCKKKEASIVNIVVENGEEYVVVKSNWKFNPRKLTENQKEKLQRKRVDIPALYQDLSQSQDEFKMTVWKTDSQDNSTTSKSSSKSTTEGADTSNILKNLNNTDVVPNIMESILGDKDKKETEKQSDKSNNEPSKDSLITAKTLTPKNKKTPRMALKDRVFRNVRNLIEKSVTPSTTKDQNVSWNQANESPTTPTTKPQDTGNLVNSAPSLPLSDRPSRVKRKPRKFDDTEIFALKKRRHSQSDSQTSDCQTTDMLENPCDTNIEELESLVSRDKENITLADNSVKCQNNLEDAKVVDNVITLEDVKGSTITTMDTTVKLDIHLSEENILSSVENKAANLSALPSKDMDVNDVTGIDNEQLKTDKEGASAIHKIEPEIIFTPKHKKVTVVDQHTPSVRKSSVKKSRIEKELAIDMVEGHPFLNTPTTSEKRKTRKNILGSENSTRRKNLSEKLNKSKIEGIMSTPGKKEKGKIGIKNSNIDEINTANDKTNSQESTSVSEESCSEDIIESSQDSTLSTITVMKKTPKRLPVVSIEKIKIISNIGNTTKIHNLIDASSEKNENTVKSSDVDSIMNSNFENVKNNEGVQEKISEKELKLQNVKETPEISEEIGSENLQGDSNIDCSLVESDSCLLNHESKDDTEFPRNKTVVEDNSDIVLTQDMDTAPIREEDVFDDDIGLTEEQPTISITSDENIVGPQTQEIAEADTQPNATIDLDIMADSQDCRKSVVLEPDDNVSKETSLNTKDNDLVVDLESKNTHSTDVEKTTDISSPFKDDVQRKQDFLNNTIEISPIKTVSPDSEKKSPSPDKSSEYVVIKLTSPVQSNGEPFEKGSPEFFTEEKMSPDKRDQSPPRAEITVTNTSPSSALSLKKNRPQVRSGGRAAQMLGLCVPDKLNPIMNSDRIDVDEGRKNSPSNTPARRNLRILYNSVGDNSDIIGENEENENFLKLKRTLPNVSSSPSGPILKRKLAEIADDTTVSPANKRKRVSFHDPPVSTTISVQKYIEPCGVRSPQSSAQKRQERQARMQANLKSPKRLDNLFTLDSVLTKTVESFTDVDLSLTNTEDTQLTSLDQTPTAEIVKTTDLNDTDPICPELLDCKDSIDIIAAELSSPAMKSLFIKELEDKVTSIGDLAKMTELEVNRLSIKAPKVKIAKKVLTDYAAKIVNNKNEVENSIKEETVYVDVVLPEQELISADIAVQTNELTISHAEMQTCDISVSLVSTQTEMAHTSSVNSQTNETGSKTTAEIIEMCLTEKPDFVPQLSKQLHECSIQQIADKLSFEAVTNTLMTKINETNTKIVLDRLLSHQCMQELDEQNTSRPLALLQEYLCDKFESKDLILFCSGLLKKMCDKSP